MAEGGHLLVKLADVGAAEAIIALGPVSYRCRIFGQGITDGEENVETLGPSEKRSIRRKEGDTTHLWAEQTKL